MNNIILKNKNDYTLKTEDGRKNLQEYITSYNNNLDLNDPLARQIGIEEALAMCNVEEFIRTKSQVAEIVREAIEIGYTVKNFRTNSIFTFARTKLKKAGYNSIIRIQLENYIKFRLHIVDEVTNDTSEKQKFKNISSFTLGNETYFYNILTGEELTGEELEKFLNYRETEKEKKLA